MVSKTADLPSVLCLPEIKHSYSREENGFDIALEREQWRIFVLIKLKREVADNDWHYYFML